MNVPFEMSWIDARPFSHYGLFSKGAAFFLKFGFSAKSDCLVVHFLLLLFFAFVCLVSWFGHQKLYSLCTTIFNNCH